MGGGGYGDPLDRDPERVRRDVIAGVVTVEHAALRYGVVVQPGGASLDEEATTRRREEIREQRRAGASRPDAGRR
jgi:N-methylhydantoinase B